MKSRLKWPLLRGKQHPGSRWIHSKNKLCSISRLQSHLQGKQDQVACKQDLLHSTIANEQRPTSSVMSSPLLSPVATWNQAVRASILETFVKSRDQSDPPPILTVQPTGRDIQQPPVIDDELQSVLDDLSSMADAASTHSHSFSLSVVEDSSSIQDQGRQTVTPGWFRGIDSGLATSTSSQCNSNDCSGAALKSMPYDSGIALDSTTDHNIGDGLGSQFPLHISPGRPNSIQLHGRNAGFQATISTFLNQVENNPGPHGSTQACGGNAPRTKLQDYTQSENAQKPSNSTMVHGRYAPESSSSKQAPLVGGSRRVGVAALTT